MSVPRFSSREQLIDRKMRGGYFSNPLRVHRIYWDRTEHFTGADILRRMLAEILGTAFLVFSVCSFARLQRRALLPDDVPDVHFMVGLVVLFIVFAFGSISGAHINPAISFAFFLRGSLPPQLLPAYWISEVTGAFLGALIAWGILGNQGGENLITLHHLSLWHGFGMEIWLTFILVCVSLAVAAQHKFLGLQAGIAEGAAVAALGLMGGLGTGAVMNPAFIAIPIVAGDVRGYVWLYVIGPMIGAAAAVIVMHLLIPIVREEEVKAAVGEPQQPSYIRPVPRHEEPAVGVTEIHAVVAEA
jgi:glycerol uptake facilitator-like aquaporin